MKRKDIITILAIAIVCGIFSFVLAKYLFGGEKSYKLTAPTVIEISSDFKTPDTAYFNSSSINLTKNIQIGDSTNSQPFNANQ